VIPGKGENSKKGPKERTRDDHRGGGVNVTAGRKKDLKSDPKNPAKGKENQPNKQDHNVSQCNQHGGTRVDEDTRLRKILRTETRSIRGSAPRPSLWTPPHSLASEDDRGNGSVLKGGGVGCGVVEDWGVPPGKTKAGIKNGKRSRESPQTKKPPNTNKARKRGTGNLNVKVGVGHSLRREKGKSSDYPKELVFL